MLAMQPSRYPKRPHTQHVERRAMHKLTCIQLCVFVLLYVVKTIKAIAIAFPLIIALCVPLRLWALPRLFTPEQLLFLDGDDEAIATAMKKKAEADVEGEGEGDAQPTSLAEASGTSATSSSSTTKDGAAYPVNVEIRDGRPTSQ